MRYCIFSDIHGNAEALYQMLEFEKEKVDAYIFLGDIFGYFYDQIEIIDCLGKIPNIYMVKGNHDDYYLKGVTNKSQNDKYKDQYGASYGIVLSDEQQTFVRQLPESITITDDSGSIIHAFHGGPNNYLEQRIYPDTRIDCMDNQCNYMLIGHTHYRFVKKNKGVTVINPGSLGQPRDGNGFSYCVLDTKTDEILFKEVHPSIKNLMHKIDIFDYNTNNGIYLKRKYEDM